jgi:hypothetical protein
MKWGKPQLVDLADRHNALNAVGFSAVDVSGSTCQPGSTHLLLCYTGGVAGLGKGPYTAPSITDSGTTHSSNLA